MDFSGIENEAEFLPSGTLSDVLKDELIECVSRWSDQNEPTHPVARLRQVSKPIIEALMRIRNENDGSRRVNLVKDMRHSLLAALGYDRSPQTILTAMSDEPEIPLSVRVADVSGQDMLWVIETAITEFEDEAADSLDKKFETSHLPDSVISETLTDLSIRDFLSEGIFGLRNGPKYVLVLGLSEIVLIDKQKWPTESVLRFNLQKIFEKCDPNTLMLVACLISQEGRVPDKGTPISDRIEEEAQRHSNSATASLKRTVREAIELLGQEVLYVTGGKYPSNFSDPKRRDARIDGDDLSVECLRYMYRLLFLLYAEANPRLGLLDMKNPVYKKGYSIETLRELEFTPLRSTLDQEGYFFWESLQCTLGLVYNGVNCIDSKKNIGISLPSVKVPLLDPNGTPLLSALKLRNIAIQKIIRLLSIQSSRKRTGRISYAKLGINQLGAVYETLISFTGTVAKTELMEVIPRSKESKSDNVDSDDNNIGGSEGGFSGEEGEIEVSDHEGVEESTTKTDSNVDPLSPIWLVPYLRFDEFGPDRVVFRGGEVLVHKVGEFVYRLSGRNREKSASYYTPEPIARLLVQHALMERCKGLSSDEVLELKILEPAMGSAAFLVETTNQIADIYLEKKQKEVDRNIPADQIVIERQRVRSYIADRNCFGVDKNPIAVELGTISMWLNGLHASDFSPWFGGQLHVGNSLIGARRAYYEPSALTWKRKSDGWLHQKPSEIGWKKEFVDGNVWHWLLPADGMQNYYKDKSISSIAKNEIDEVSDWKRGGFFKKFQDHEVKTVIRLSRVAEDLFQKVAKDLGNNRQLTSDEIIIWPDRKMEGTNNVSFDEKDRRRKRLVGEDNAINTLPYRRLKTAMDAWCALWLWPLDKASLLPSRAEFLQGMTMILEGGFVDGIVVPPSMYGIDDPEPSLFRDADHNDSDMESESHIEVRSPEKQLFYETNVDRLTENFDWLKVARDVAVQARFVHFDLIFSDIMKERGGFDLIVGNPPWIKPTWNEGKVLSDIDPVYDGISPKAARKRLPSALLAISNTREDKNSISANSEFLREFVSTRGEMEVTSSELMNPYAGGGANNFYRCFIDLSFRLTSQDGYCALIHQDGHLGDPSSGSFRRHWYSRICKYFEFRNEIQSKMFSEVHHNLIFSLNVYRGYSSDVCFDSVSSAFLPSQINESYVHDGSGPVDGIKRYDGSWNTSGHRDRVITIESETLGVIHSLSEDAHVPVNETRLIRSYSAQVLDIFRLLSRFEKLFESMQPSSDSNSERRDSLKANIPNWQISPHWHQTSRVNDGTIHERTSFRSAEQAIIQGPHIYVGNPFYKTPKAISQKNSDYDVIDLRRIPEDYFPRSNFQPGIPMHEYHNLITKCNWDLKKTQADLYRIAVRSMISLSGERSLISAIIPKKVTHVNAMQSVAFKFDHDLLSGASLLSSLVLDFYIKASGRQSFQNTDARRLPWTEAGPTAQSRTLRLSCLTTDYEDLWNRNAKDLSPMQWSSADTRLGLEGPASGPVTWNYDAALRTDFARRMALVEIDVLVAQAFGMTVDQLIDIYRIYFPILRENESNTWYDQEGKVVWTSSKGLTGVGFIDEETGKSPSKNAWEKNFCKDPKLSCSVMDDTLPGGPRRVDRHFIGPFTRCNRIEDYRCAWTHFEKLKAEGGA